MRRRPLFLVIGVALPTVLLAAGWSMASWRERESTRRERLAFVERTADAVQLAVDESLLSLGGREDARPFYLYNHYYSPPEVLAVSDPVAVSPLAQEPEDPRVSGYFQIDPDGTLRTPYEADPSHEPGARTRAVTLALRGPAFDDLRTLAHGSATSGLVPVAPPAEPDGPEVALLDARTRPRGEGGRQGTSVDADLSLTPEGPLTVSLNAWGQSVYSDVAAAQQGDALANQRVEARGRAAPQTVRNVVSWDSVDNPVAAQAQQATVAPRRESERPRRIRRAPEPPPSDPRPPPLPLIRENEIQVDYTPMAFISAHGATTLQRVVSHEGTAVVQGALIDRAYVFETWLPEVIARAGAGLPISIVAAGEDAPCVVRRPASELVTGADLCVAPLALARVTEGADGMLTVQLGALVGLVLIVVFAGALIDRAARRADALSRQKSDFVSAVSHELRTPLTTIRMHAEMLREGMVSEDKKARFHDDLVNESIRLSHLVDNVLELSRIEQGKRPMKLSEGDLAAFARGVIEGQRRFLADRGVTVRGPSDDASVVTLFDRQAAEQILLNLLANAAKYGQGAEGVVDVEVREEGSGAALSVLDRGPGIPESERENVFDRFHRVEREDTAHMPGTGIGLALVRDLARAHGGDAVIRARPGGGCEVRVTLSGQ
jgi:signal transduction histidine kinase